MIVTSIFAPITTRGNSHVSKIIPLFSNKTIPSEVYDVLCIKDQKGWNITPINEIVRCQADDNYSIIYTASNQKISASMTLKQLEGKLNKKLFVRCHQSHLVALSHIRRIQTNGMLHLANGVEIPVSRRKRKDLLKIFIPQID